MISSYFGELSALSAALCWSIAVIIFKSASKTLSPILITALKNSIALFSFLLLFMFLDIPLIGNTPSDILPTLSWNTAYTVAFSYGSGSGNGYASSTSTNSSSTITLADGNTITQNNFDVSGSLSDSAPFGSSNGTTLNGGQFPVLGFLF